ncbi:TPA_asm: tail protein [Caudoviricetes sp. vir555]|nr:TPA_asm: tail protein [Caudoviricetes sp. vir555]
MTVSNTDSPVKIYTGTATEYPIPFDYISDNDILVTLYNTETGVSTDQTKDVHYTISDETVIYSEAPGSVYNVVIRRVTPYTQEASFGPGEEPPLSTYESCFDKLTMLAQDLNERLERCIMFPDSYSGTDFELPNPTGNAGKLIRINEDGTGLDVLAVSESGQATEVTDYCDTADLVRLHTIGKIKARAYRNAAQDIDATSATKILIDTISFDTEGVVDIANSRIVPNLPGYYIVIANIRVGAVPDGCRVTAVILKNGIIASYGTHVHQGATGYSSSSASDLIYMNGTTDYLELRAYNSHSSALALYMGGSIQNYISIVGPF